jgi:hypothetical protein
LNGGVQRRVALMIASVNLLTKMFWDAAIRKPKNVIFSQQARKFEPFGTNNS